MAGGLGGGVKKKDSKSSPYSQSGRRVETVGGQTRAFSSGRPYQEPIALGSSQSGPPNPFLPSPFRGTTPSGGGGGGGGGGWPRGGGAGGGGGGGDSRSYTGPTFNFQEMQQDLKPNEFQTGAYEKMEGLYDEVPDYFTRALAQSRMAGSQGIESELEAAGGRGFGPGSGFTGRALADYGRGVNQMIMGGQMDAAQKTFADKMQLASGMGNLGTGIAGNLAQMYGMNIGAYNAMANYALGNERNQIGWYDSQTRAQQGWMDPMIRMAGMIMQSGAFL